MGDDCAPGSMGKHKWRLATNGMLLVWFFTVWGSPLAFTVLCSLLQVLFRVLVSWWGVLSMGGVRVNLVHELSAYTLGIRIDFLGTEF